MDVGGSKDLTGAVVVVQRNTDLLKVAHIFDAACRLAEAVHCRQQQRHKDSAMR